MMNLVNEFFHFVNMVFACLLKLIELVVYSHDGVFFFIFVFLIVQIHFVQQNLRYFNKLLVSQLEVLISRWHLKIGREKLFELESLVVFKDLSDVVLDGLLVI